MSLNSSIQIGRSALSASQLGIQIASNNLANAGTAGYSRQVGDLEAMRGDGSLPGGGIGRGVRVAAVRRQIDTALQQRLIGSESDTAAASTRQQMLSQVETTLGELGDSDLSSQLSSYFKSWSERANNTQSSAAVVRNGDNLAQFVRTLRSQLSDQRTQIDSQISNSVIDINQQLDAIARFNKAISTAEGGGATANTLRDQRDESIRKLASYCDISTVDRGIGGVDVLIGSAPVVLGDRTTPIEVVKTQQNGMTQVSLRTTGSRAQELNITSGQVGELLTQRTTAVDGTIAKLDKLASNIIFEVNKLHAQGTPPQGLTSATSNLSISVANRSLAINDPANDAFAGLPFKAVNGGFVVQVKQQSTGAVTSTRINIDLDGITSTFAPGTTNDTTPESIRAALNAIPGLNATFSADGKLTLASDTGFSFALSDDSSGVLGVMGVNAYFTGTSAADIAVRPDLLADSSKLSAAALISGQLVDNHTALGISRLADSAISNLGGRSITGAWIDTANDVGAASAAAKTSADARAIVHESLQSQRDSLSGVNTDEESISLLDFQRQYQAAARVISTVDQLTQALLSLV